MNNNEAIARLQAAADIAISTGCELAKMPAMDALAIADLLKKQEAVATDTNVPGKWISVKDRIPEKPGRYLCWFGKNTFAVGASIVSYIPDLHWFASLKSLERYENVTHWMPMPEPPKEEDECNTD